MSEAIGIFFTFTTYGSHLPGAGDQSVSHTARQHGAPRLSARPTWESQARRLIPESPFCLGPSDRERALTAIRNACLQRNWPLSCVHIRTNHVHVVCQPGIIPAQALAYLKARATHAIKPDHPTRTRFWSKHGSTRYLWSKPALAAAANYVLNEQGHPLARWPTPQQSEP